MAFYKDEFIPGHGHHISGSEDNDYLFGDHVMFHDWNGPGQNDDTIDGGGGDDTIQAGLGNDVLTGDNGNDTIFGSGTIYGGDGDDTIHTFQQAPVELNVVNGNQGDDTIIGGSDKAEWLSGGQGNDQIEVSGNGHDFVNGNMGNDTIFVDVGLTTDVTLRGGQGDDHIVGSGGNDQIYGDLGRNVVAGGPGADIFHVGLGHTEVTDFDVSTGDRVALDGRAVTSVVQTAAGVVVTVAGGGEIALDGAQLGDLQTHSGWIG